MTLKELLGDSYKDGMTPGEIEAALASIQLPTDTKEVERLQKALTKSNSEAADYKRKLQEKQTEEERAEAERAEKTRAMEEELNTLKTQKAVADNKAQFLALGYDDALATETAEAMVQGDMTKVFANQKKHQEAQRAALEAELLAKTPTPPAGDGTDTMTKEKFAKLGYEDRVKLFNENPTLYNELAKTEN